MATLMWNRALLVGLVALGLTIATSRAPAQTFSEPVVARAIGAAGALAARVRGLHRWTGMTPVPVDYCDTMREGEAVMKELARLASRAILYRVPGLALRLQHAGDLLSDELDIEEEANQQADIPYSIYPCPTPPGPYPQRALPLRLIEARAPTCRRRADALRISFEARRAWLQQCLRVPGL
jgi:hypothetical protein